MLVFYCRALLISPCHLPRTGCKVLKGALVGASDLHSLQEAVEYDFHAILHSQIGGVWDCGDDIGELLEENPSWQAAFEMVAASAGLCVMLSSTRRIAQPR